MSTIFTALECTEELTKEFIKQSLSNIKLFDKKQRDYGSGNIARFGEQGVLVRSSDKFERLVILLKKPPAFIVDPKVDKEEWLTVPSAPGTIILSFYVYFTPEQFNFVPVYHSILLSI